MFLLQQANTEMNSREAEPSLQEKYQVQLYETAIFVGQFYMVQFNAYKSINS
jgi:hypothetical protein